MTADKSASVASLLIANTMMLIKETLKSHIYIVTVLAILTADTDNADTDNADTDKLLTLK